MRSTTRVTERGEPVSCNDDTALALYEHALTQFQSYRGDPIATIDQALTIAPDFVMGHVLKAMLFMTLSERRFAEQARVSVASAEALLPRANDREQALVAAARTLVNGDWGAGAAALDRVLVDHPRDILAIQTGHILDFFRGDALNLRNRIVRVLPHWSASVPGYSYLLGMYAFGLEECNQYALAEEIARRALELEPTDGWAVHAGTHVMEMQGRIDEGIAWLTSREKDWAPGSSFAYHNHWHLALFHLDQERYAEALALYDAQIHREPPDFALQLVDATALLWRLHLDGVDLEGRPAILADNWARRLDTERGYYAFNDMHAMMAFAMAGRRKEAELLLADVDWALENGPATNRRMTLEVGRPICRALHAFGQGRDAEVLSELAPVRDIAGRFGGSHAQRDALTLTLIASAIRGGQPALARHYLAERLVLKPASRWARRLQARAGGMRHAA
jgi:tetratricopeptide (TPR) repeat protein